MACLRVYPVHDDLPGKEVWLILRRNEGEKEIKYQFSNASADTSIKRLGQMSCSRYWIERIFQDAKGNAGMADYQVRSWTGWHHHMVMTMLAMLFIMEMQVKWGKKKRLENIQAAKKKLEEQQLNKINITDNDAKIMKHKDGIKKPSYNGQVAVDNKEQVIVAADLVDEENDVHQMDPMIQHIHAILGYKPTIVLADAGYFSYDNIELLIQEGIDAYIPDNFFDALAIRGIYERRCNLKSALICVNQRL